jgi:hypothetical protein
MTPTRAVIRGERLRKARRQPGRGSLRKARTARGMDLAAKAKGEAIMTYPLRLSLWSTLLVAGCAQLHSPGDSADYAARMNKLGERYVQCVTQETDKAATSAAGAEDIAIAAHGLCYPAWSAYQRATSESFSYGAETPAEVQLAKDKADAHLRQFERETRRRLVDRLVERTLQGGKSNP